VALLIVVLLVLAPVASGQSAQINVTNATNGTAGPVNTTTVTNGTNATNTTVTNGSGGSGDGGGGFGFGVPSTGDIVGDAVNGTVNSLTTMFARALGGVLMVPWQLIAVRGAPFDAAAEAASSPGGLFSRPDAPVYGQLHDMATGSLFALAVLLFVLMFVLDWFGNFSPNGSMSSMDRLFLRAADMLHLLFSWPIAWGHFLLASAIALWLLPSAEVVGGSLETATSNIIGLGLVGAALVFSVVGLLVAVYLVVKHAGAFIYLVVGLAAYPVLVAMSIPDHWLLGSLGEYGERARKRYPVAAWYPVPTALVLNVGYAIAGPVANLFDGLALSETLAAINIGAIYFPILWLAALYAPVKLFSGGELGEKLKRAATAGAVGGATGAATGSAAGASAGAASGSAAGASSGAAAGAGAASGGALTSGTTSAAGRLTAGTGAGVGSAGAKTLAGDGGTTTVGGSTFNGSGGASSSSGSLDAASPSPGEVDLNQRYEPTVQHDSGKLARVERPRDGDWLVNQGGANRLDSGTDDPLYFKGETDGKMYDLRRASSDNESFSGASSGESVRDT